MSGRRYRKVDKNDEYNVLRILFWFVVFVLFAGLTTQGNKSEDSTVADKKRPAYQQVYTYTPSKIEDKVDDKDPYSLSMKRYFYYGDKQLRGFLARTELEYPSKVEKLGTSNYRYSWILKSNNKVVYECEYSFNRQRKKEERSIVACEIKEGYEDWKNGDRRLYRDYYMPVADGEIDMIVSDKDTYYKSYFALGKFSDMKCYVKGNNIYCTFYWYQKTDRGPMLVYTSTATNRTTTAGWRYNSWLWERFDETMDNIDIIPYDEYPRSYDYMQIYKKWEKEEMKRESDRELKEQIELYCVFDDAEDLFYEYPDDFEYWEDAEDFYDTYCE